MKVAKLGIALLALCSPAAVMSGSPTIYRCDGDGAVIYSDRPCAANAAIHENDSSRVTVYEAPSVSERAASSRSSKPAGRKTKSTDKAGVGPERRAAQREAACAKLDQALRDVRTKMRTGYGVKEGERLKARQKQIAERRRGEKCG